MKYIIRSIIRYDVFYGRDTAVWWFSLIIIIGHKAGGRNKYILEMLIRSFQYTVGSFHSVNFFRTRLSRNGGLL